MKWAKGNSLDDLATEFQEIKKAFADYKTRVNNNICKAEIKAQLFSGVEDLFNPCMELQNNIMSDALCDPFKDCPPETDLGLEDSVSQVASCQGTLSTTSSKLLARQIDLDRRRAELRTIHARDLARAKADAAAAAAAELDAEARLRIGEAKHETEEKYIALPESGSSVAVSERFKNKLRLSSVVTSSVHKTTDTRKTDLNQKCANDYFCKNGNVSAASCQPALAASKAFNYKNASGEIKPKIEWTCRADPGLRPAASSQRQEATANLVTANTVGFEAYLKRQGRNEFINLASQIAYDGTNIAFVFYENQIQKLMSKSPCDERRLEVFRASCIGQPREMVNLFIAPMRCMSTAQQIEKALDRLRQRFGVSGGLTTEPQIIDIRLGPRVVFSTASLKSYNEDLNTLEVFAYAHDEVEKLSLQLLMDVVNCLPGVLKRRYLDYLKNRALI